MNWIKNSYARFNLDNHITDLKAEFMSKADPAASVKAIKDAGFKSAQLFSCDHNGNCYYPTKVGHQHANLNGRDIFGELVAESRKQGIIPIAYYTATFHNDCVKRMPHVEVYDECHSRKGFRMHCACSSHDDAVEFFCKQLEEVMQYDIEGLFIDMTYWPIICTCGACRKKYGKKLPEYINWNDPAWIDFQRFREKSLVEFADKLTNFVKNIKPHITVTHQFSPMLHGWYLAQSSGLMSSSDYATGDFYGDKLQQRFAVKAFNALSRCKPFEFMASCTTNLTQHTADKAPQEMKLSAMTTLANGGAYMFIDAVNSDGTVRQNAFDAMKYVNDSVAPITEAVCKSEAQLSSDVGLYFSMSCCIDKNLNGVKLDEFHAGRGSNMDVKKNAVLDEALGTAEILIKMHVPFKIISENDTDFSKYKTIIVNNCAYLDKAEQQRFRDFTANGGTLICTGDTSLFDKDGIGGKNFALADLMGVDFTGEYSDTVTYTGEELVFSSGRIPFVTPREKTVVKAALTLPDFPVGHAELYAAVHSNPPGITSNYPAWTENNYGKGKCVYLAPAILIHRQYTQQNFAKKFLKSYLPEFVAETKNLSESTEITFLETNEPDKFIFAAVNYQNEFPVIPLKDVTIKLCFKNKVKSIINIADNSEVEFIQDAETLTFSIPEINEGFFCYINC